MIVKDSNDTPYFYIVKSVSGQAFHLSVSHLLNVHSPPLPQFDGTLTEVVIPPQGRCKVVRRQEVPDLCGGAKLPNIATTPRSSPSELQTNLPSCQRWHSCETSFAPDKRYCFNFPTGSTPGKNPTSLLEVGGMNSTPGKDFLSMRLLPTGRPQRLTMRVNKSTSNSSTDYSIPS